MRKINYSKFDLDNFTDRELQRICRYYGIEVFPEWDKERLIQEILDYSPAELIRDTFNPEIINLMPIDYTVDLIPTEVKKSIRVSRIEKTKG